MSCGFVHIQSYSCSICVYTYTHKQNLGPLLSSALDSKVWRQDKKTLLRPHTCCNLQGNLQALSANRFAMDWGAIEASLREKSQISHDITVIHSGKMCKIV